MRKSELLLSRLREIGDSLSKSEYALSLLALGSCGIERERLDEYSDLDFFVIVEDGYKDRFLTDLDWLASIAPIGYLFQNTADGYKLLFQDGVFCEFAVFEHDELDKIAFSKGLVIWVKEGYDDKQLCLKAIHNNREMNSIDWIIGEALTNIYVGLCRYKRGERYSAYKFVQNYAVDRVLDLISLLEQNEQDYPDIFDNGRRIESRYPKYISQLNKFVQGYDKTPESARSILDFIDGNYEVNKCIKSKILELIK